MIRCRKPGYLRYMVLLPMVLLVLGGCSHRHSVGREGDGVMLFLELPAADEVQFASSVDDFHLRPARRDGQGRWVVDGLKNEAFQYFYVVDGTVFVPECRYRQQDDFGTINCVYQP
ncbi:MAG: hypothetical protein IH612_15905 [Desulfofustis sp.]|nr:hypothetical protein [Desulfofustis sp.]